MMSTTLPRSDLPGGIAAWRGGDGPPMLLIHGVGLRAEAWDRMLPRLVAHFSVTAVDLPGHGNSKGFDERPALSAYTDRIAGIVDAPSLIVGHSMGALIALDMAIRHTHIVSAIAPLNAVFRRSDAARQAVQMRAAELTAAKPTPDATLQRWFGDAPTGEMKSARDACRDWLSAADPQGYHNAYSVFAHEDGPTDADLSALACPALFVTGSDEPNSTPAMSRALAELTPLGRARIIAGARHMMPMTHPQAVCDLLIEFHHETNG